MKIVITYRYFLCLMHVLLGTISYGASIATYESASVTPYYIDDSGKVYFLLGKEDREGEEYWYNFGGNKDAADAQAARSLKIEPSLFTAKRETQEETAHQIFFKNDNLMPIKPWYMAARPEEGFWVQAKKPTEPYSVGYFLSISYVDPAKIKQAAKKLSGSKAISIEKNAWQWIEAQDFMNWVKYSKLTDYKYPSLSKPIFPIYKATLSVPEVQEYIQSILDTAKKMATKTTKPIIAISSEESKKVLQDIGKILLKYRKRPTFAQWFAQFDNDYKDGDAEKDYDVLGGLRSQIESLGPNEAAFIDTYLREYDTKLSSSPVERKQFIDLLTPLAQKIFITSQFSNVQVAAVENDLNILEKIGPETAKALKGIFNKKKKEKQ